MEHKQTGENTTEGALRQRLAAYFLSAPSLKEQTASQRREYLERLRQLGELEQQELLEHAGAARPMVWANPTPLIQAVCGAVQRLAAGLGHSLCIFPAAGILLGSETLVHPRMLTVTLCALLTDLCRRAQGQTVWVRLQEMRYGLAVAVSLPEGGLSPRTAALIAECTRLHGGSLVHSDNTLIFSCGQAEKPDAGVRLYAVPTEQELLDDSLSPVWSVFYSSSGSTVSRSPASTIPSCGEDSSALR